MSQPKLILVLLLVAILNQPLLAETITLSNTAIHNPNWATLINTQYNLYRVAPNFYRSQQITSEMLPILKQLKIKTVVSLRFHNRDQEILGDSSIHSINVPMHSWHIEDEDVVAALCAIRQAGKKDAILLHCQHGSDRTGVIVAAYRIICQDWTKEQAVDELEHGDYNFHSIWFNIPYYLHNLDSQKIKLAVASAEKNQSCFYKGDGR